jgi:hypothetical protein
VLAAGLWAVAAPALLGACKRKPQAELVFSTRIQVVEATLAGNPDLGMDEAAFATEVGEALERTGRLRPLTPEEQAEKVPGAPEQPFLVRAEVESAHAGAGPQLEAELTVALELQRASAKLRDRFRGRGSGRASYAAGDPDARAQALREALERALDQAAAGALVQLDARAKTEPALVADLTHPEVRVREAAILQLAERKSRDAVPALVERLQDPDPTIVHRAIGALIAIGDRRAVNPFIELTRKRPGEFVSQLVYALGELGGEEAEGFLFTVETGHPDEAVRKAATQALSDLQRRKQEVHR